MAIWLAVEASYLLAFQRVYESSKCFVCAFKILVFEFAKNSKIVNFK
jgi:hypothetical protein